MTHLSQDEPVCETCDGEGEVCVGFGIYSDMRPGIAICPDCREEAPMTGRIWLVTHWICGNGGDDERRIVAVCTTSEKAYEIAGGNQEWEVAAYPLDEVVPGRFE